MVYALLPILHVPRQKATEIYDIVNKMTRPNKSLKPICELNVLEVCIVSTFDILEFDLPFSSVL